MNNDPRMGLRDIAAWMENADSQKIGPTHTIKGLVDYRNVDRDPVFMPFVAALGNAYIEELTA